MSFNVFRYLKDALISFNSNRTMPSDLRFFNGRYWLECQEPTHCHFFESEDDDKEYKYKWVEFKQGKFGVWFRVDSFLLTNTNYREVNYE